MLVYTVQCVPILTTDLITYTYNNSIDIFHNLETYFIYTITTYTTIKMILQIYFYQNVQKCIVRV